MKRFFLPLLCAAVLSAAATVTHGARRPARGGTVRLPTEGPILSFDPAEVSWPTEDLFVSLVYDTPLRWTKTYGPRPQLLVPLYVSDDQRVVRFRVRRHAVFHDGTQVKASHVAASLQRLAKSRPSGWLLAMVKGVKATDSRTVELRLEPKRSYDLLKTALTTPQAAVARSGAQASKGVGSGPFRYRKSKSAGRHLRANRDYFDGPPYLDQVVLLPSLGRADHIRRFQLGRAEGSLLGMSVYGEAADPAVATKGPRAHLVALVCNTRKGPAQNGALRKAIHLALNRARLASGIGSPAGFPGAKAIPPRNQAVATKLVKGLGASTKSLVLLVHGEDPRGVALAPLIQRDLSAVGIATQIQVLSQGAYRARLSAKSWDLRLLNVSNGHDDVVIRLGQLLALGGLSSDAANLMRTAGPQRAKAIRAAHTALATKLALIPVAWRAPRLHHRKTLRHVRYDPLGRLDAANMWLLSGGS